MNRRNAILYGMGVSFWIPAVAAYLFLSIEVTIGQEALQVSLQGDQASAVQAQVATAVGYYNLLLGPTAWRFSSGLGVSYNDNIHLQQKNPEGDFIFSPNANAQMTWPVTPLNTLNLTIGGGYSIYLQNSDLDGFFINQGSGLSFDVYVSDIKINLHDRISITQNAYQNQSANGSTIYSSLQNTAGANALWNLNGGEVTLGYDHVNYMALTSTGNSTPDATTDNFSLSGGIHVMPEVLVGLATSGSLISYANSDPATAANYPDTAQWSAGAFCSTQISEYFSARLDAGYTELLPDSTTNNFNGSSSSGYYFDLKLTHRVNQFLQYSLSAYRSIDYQYSGQPYERHGVEWQPAWNVFEYFTIDTPLKWEHGTQVNFASSTYDQYSAGINFHRQITQKLTGSLSYQFVRETSEGANQSYTVNIVSLNFTYQF